MRIYLAGQNGIHGIIGGALNDSVFSGGVSGNLKPAFRNMARNNDISQNGFIKALKDENFWQGGESRHWLHEASPIKENENISCRCSTVERRGGYDPIIKEHHPYILESFYYTDDDTERLLPLFGDFLLDSGAFTFMQSSKKAVKWEEYIEKYADFINRNKIEKFFELDIDNLVGYDKVLEYRKLLERLTNKQSIPVWHKSRGMKEFSKMCDEYSYASIGGIVIKEIKPEQYKLFPAMITEAHKKKCKIHGLGFTNLTLLPKIHFDSVDSTAWTTGNRFGFIYHFNGKTMKKIDAPKGKRLADSRKIALINYTEWIKFQKYAEANL